jgi:sulfate permease, SulP family
LIIENTDRLVREATQSETTTRIEALNRITERYHKAGKKLHLKHLSPDCRQLLKNAEQVIDVNIIEDLTYRIAVDGLA